MVSSYPKDTTSEASVYAIEYIDYAPDRAGAVEMLDWLENQQGYLGGRLLPGTAAFPRWRVQVFFKDEGETENLPDGCNRRLMAGSALRNLIGVKR